jgi:ubiquinone/menaquinone biosynthesis C-methylase UbiE
MAEKAYIFADTASDSGMQRLGMLEAALDEDTRRWLRSTRGSLASRRCLEVRAGAGSIASWLASEVGSTGRVVAVDQETKFLRNLSSSIEVVRGRVGDVSIPPAEFDLVYARYVLTNFFKAFARK